MPGALCLPEAGTRAASLRQACLLSEAVARAGRLDRMTREERQWAMRRLENLVEYVCADRIATLTLNRPEKLNAFSDELVRHLADALRRFDLDPEARSRDPLRRRPRVFERRRRASAPAAAARGIPRAWRPAGLGRQFRRSADPVGQLEAGDRRTARLCDGARPRHRARMRSDRRRSRDQIPDHRDLARARRLEILGAAEFPRRRGALPPRWR